MKYSPGPANRALTGGCRFQARGREGRGHGSRSAGSMVSLERAKGSGQWGQRGGWLGTMSRGGSVHHTSTGDLLAAHECVCKVVHMCVRVCAYVCVC